METGHATTREYLVETSGCVGNQRGLDWVRVGWDTTRWGSPLSTIHFAFSVLAITSRDTFAGTTVYHLRFSWM